MAEHREALELRVRALISQQNLQKAIEVALLGEGPELLGYSDEFLKYIRKELKEEEQVQDLFALFSKNLWGGIQSFRQDSSFRTWAYTILRNTILRSKEEQQKKDLGALRIKASNGNSSQEDPNGDGEFISESKIPFDGVSPSSLLRHEEEKVLLRELRRKLSQADQDLMTMIIDRSMSHEEVAETLSKLLGKVVLPETIRQRYHRAQERLKKLALEAGFISE